MESQGMARDWIKRACLVWPFPCLGSNGLWGHIPVGIASCIEAMQPCLLVSSWRWIQAAYGLTWLWRTINRGKCRISLLQRQLASISLSMFACICILHWWVLCLWKAIGLLFCRSAAPRPTSEALTCMVTGSDGSKYLRVVLLMTACLTCWKAAS